MKPPLRQGRRGLRGATLIAQRAPGLSGSRYRARPAAG